MTEIARNSGKTVYLDMYGEAADAIPTATVKVNDTESSLTVTEVTPAPTGIEKRYAASLSVAHTQNDGLVVVEWSFDIDDTPVVKKDYFEVITPYLTISEVKAIIPDATTSEAQEAEASVRFIINAHCGQDFGNFVGTRSVRGSGSSAIQLPVRLISLDDVAANGHFILSNNGWVLRSAQWGVPPVKADNDGLHMHVGGVIHNPNNVKLGTFQDSWEYQVTGSWGWEYVPNQVKEAAKLLLADYSDPDSEYRDRYLTSMTAADWRIQFHSGAFDKTGNVRADQLLSRYVIKNGWAVV